MALEKNDIKLGLVPLIDAAPLIVAKEKGFFEEQGLNVTLSVEASWASIRDKVAAGLLDAAHMLAPMPIAATAGIDGVGVPMMTALSLNLNGNAIAVSQSLYWRLQLDELTPSSVGERLKRVLDADRAAGAPPRVFAHVFPFSPHHYELRYWLAGCDIDPDRDLQLVVIPPPQMVRALRDGSIDGFCVGAPWGAVAQAAGIGRVVLNKYQIWNNSPEKVLGVTRAWAEAHPQTHLALIAALIRAAQWLDQPANRSEAARLIVEGHYVEATPETVHESLAVGAPGKPENAGLVFHAGAATFPWVSHALWFVGQMRRWNQLPHGIDGDALARASYRPDLYRAAAAQFGMPCPAVDLKSEGQHAGIHTLSRDHTIELGADRFFDGAGYSPS
jgi:ABC-type nitrate/sulfonate/bicarbonate transport system substrate-binding protein